MSAQLLKPLTYRRRVPGLRDYVTAVLQIAQKMEIARCDERGGFSVVGRCNVDDSDRPQPNAGPALSRARDQWRRRIIVEDLLCLQVGFSDTFLLH